MKGLKDFLLTIFKKTPKEDTLGNWSVDKNITKEILGNSEAIWISKEIY